MAKKSLAETHPEIAKQWHPTKNGPLKPSEITTFSHKKVWWKCDRFDDHEWYSIVANRTKNNTGCAVCAGKIITRKNCFAVTHPEIAKQWHPTKNGDLTPFDFLAGSHRKVWWKCNKGDDHEWLTDINHRTRGRKCPYCSGNKVSKTNSLKTINPELAKEWHPTKNDTLTPNDITSGSEKKVWWKCEKGDDHEWIASVKNRSKGSGCSICRGLKVVPSNSLMTINPGLAKEWHPTKNGELTPLNITPGSKKKVWWICDEGDDHEWLATVNNRSKGNGCSVCSGDTVVRSNSLGVKNPELAKEWHPTKNGDLSPFDVSEMSGKKVWWKCKKGDDHEWLSDVNHRSDGRGCPICSGVKVVFSNCLSNLRPELAKEWHPTKNGGLTPLKVTTGSNKKVWWKCDKGDDHEWQTTVDHRARDRNCPFCTLTPQSKQELIITFELRKFFRGIDPKGYKTFLSGKLRSIDIYIPKLNLCIEFDGSYWHKGKRGLDKIKSEMIFKEGFKLIRVREEPLKKIYDTDVISTKPYDGKQVTNDILSVILEKYDLDDTKVSKIKEYQQREELQNEKALDRYIDKILTEKAEKKDKSRASA